MPSDETARPTSGAASIRTPDQLQQAKRADEAQAGAAADRPQDATDAGPGSAGVLGQLETERAHD